MLEVIGLEDEQKWIDTVTKFSRHDVYHLPQYVKAFEIHGDGKPLLFSYTGDQFKAINVVMRRDLAECEYFRNDLAKNTMFDLSTPYGYGGFLIEGEHGASSLDSLNAEYIDYCQNHGFVSEFVRFHPILENFRYLHPIYDITELGKTVCVDVSSEESIWNNLDKKNLNRVRKAQKSDIKIHFGKDDHLFSSFKDLYYSVMQRNQATPYYYFSEAFFRSVAEDLANNVIFSYATFNDQIVAMCLILFCNGQMHLHLAASNSAYSKLSPNNLLCLESALWGCEHGFQTYHLGGGIGGREDSLYHYKKGYNIHSDHIFAIGKKIFDQEKYDFLLNIRKKNQGPDFNPDFFPQYRG